MQIRLGNNSAKIPDKNLNKTVSLPIWTLIWHIPLENYSGSVADSLFMFVRVYVIILIKKEVGESSLNRLYILLICIKEDYVFVKYCIGKTCVQLSSFIVLNGF